MKSTMPNMPGAGPMTDTLEFVKKLWGGLSVPGMVAPTVSTDELDKQITDLKTVETWLTMNMNMLRGSIQALEVQRATIATLKSMGDAFSAATQTATPDTADTAEKAAFDPAAFWSSLMTAPATPAAPAAKEPVASAPASKPVAEPAPAPAPATDKYAADKPDARADMVGQMVNPAAWWNVVQDQFKQAVSSAVASEKVEKTAAPAAAPKRPRAAARPAAKPAAGKAAPRKRPAAK